MNLHAPLTIVTGTKETSNRKDLHWPFPEQRTPRQVQHTSVTTTSHYFHARHQDLVADYATITNFLTSVTKQVPTLPAPLAVQALSETSGILC